MYIILTKLSTYLLYVQLKTSISKESASTKFARQVYTDYLNLTLYNCTTKIKTYVVIITYTQLKLKLKKLQINLNLKELIHNHKLKKKDQVW